MRNNYYYIFFLHCRTALAGGRHIGLDMESSDLEWTNADLFFLVDTLRHGMPVDRVAGFLNRSETEVRAKERELKAPVASDGLDEVRPLRRKRA